MGHPQKLRLNFEVTYPSGIILTEAPSAVKPRTQIQGWATRPPAQAVEGHLRRRTPVGGRFYPKGRPKEVKIERASKPTLRRDCQPATNLAQPTAAMSNSCRVNKRSQRPKFDVPESDVEGAHETKKHAYAK
jgi:hypothetical protein